jgi:hypothetical protein
MKKYSAKVKLPGGWRWEKFENVVGDGVEAAFQFLVLEDQTYIRIPLNALIVFSKERYYTIHSNMEREIGQKIPTN